jgi:hypothetical protein
MINEKYSNRIMLVIIPTTVCNFMQVNKIREINYSLKKMNDVKIYKIICVTLLSICVSSPLLSSSQVRDE